MRKKIWGAFLAVCLMAIPLLGQAQTEQEERFERAQEERSETIEHWIRQLAAKDDRFSSYLDAERHWQTLGSDGGHRLIVVGERHQPLGYFIARMENGKANLVEYGLGPEILFSNRPVVSMPTPQRAPRYAGLESVWVTEDGLRDAKSGEIYPQESSLPTFSPTDAIAADERLTAVQSTHFASSPRLWTKRETEIIDEAELVATLDNGEKVDYLAELFEGVVIAPFAVKGYHRWERSTFIELEDNGSRFVPARHAFRLGVFYP